MKLVPRASLSLFKVMLFKGWVVFVSPLTSCLMREDWPVGHSLLAVTQVSEASQRHDTVQEAPW